MTVRWLTIVFLLVINELPVWQYCEVLLLAMHMVLYREQPTHLTINESRLSLVSLVVCNNFSNVPAWTHDHNIYLEALQITASMADRRYIVQFLVINCGTLIQRHNETVLEASLIVVSLGPLVAAFNWLPFADTKTSQVAWKQAGACPSKGRCPHLKLLQGENLALAVG